MLACVVLHCEFYEMGWLGCVEHLYKVHEFRGIKAQSSRACTIQRLSFLGCMMACNKRMLQRENHTTEISIMLPLRLRPGFCRGFAIEI